ncbi:hypothetical protein HDU76_012662 [Blyttiomyces sp. JEL0837]|nr:hypothetical protein HDU76_012662 [Blyttiomyces sp. JEL0837]
MPPTGSTDSITTSSQNYQPPTLLTLPFEIHYNILRYINSPSQIYTTLTHLCHHFNQIIKTWPVNFQCNLFITKDLNGRYNPHDGNVIYPDEEIDEFGLSGVLYRDDSKCLFEELYVGYLDGGSGTSGNGGGMVMSGYENNDDTNAIDKTQVCIGSLTAYIGADRIRDRVESGGDGMDWVNKLKDVLLERVKKSFCGNVRVFYHASVLYWDGPHDEDDFSGYVKEFLAALKPRKITLTQFNQNLLAPEIRLQELCIEGPSFQMLMTESASSTILADGQTSITAATPWHKLALVTGNTLQKLTLLRVDDVPTINSVHGIEGLPELLEFNVGKGWLGDSAFDYEGLTRGIGKLRNLRRLKLPNPISEPTFITLLQHLPSLYHIENVTADFHTLFPIINKNTSTFMPYTSKIRILGISYPPSGRGDEDILVLKETMLSLLSVAFKNLVHLKVTVDLSWLDARRGRVNHGNGNVGDRDNGTEADHDVKFFMEVAPWNTLIRVIKRISLSCHECPIKLKQDTTTPSTRCCCDCLCNRWLRRVVICTDGLRRSDLLVYHARDFQGYLNRVFARCHALTVDWQW